jgi:hypothetical protein
MPTSANVAKSRRQKRVCLAAVQTWTSPPTRERSEQWQASRSHARDAA